jgi:hypothetical protein
MKNLFVLSLASLVAIIALGCGGGGSSSSCTVEAGQCPNVCDAGTAQTGELCSLDVRCACGLACKSNAGGAFVCQAYDGENAGCTGCKGDEPPADAGDTTTPPPPPDTSTVDINNCDKKVPPSEVCNPYCQLGCPADKQCTRGNFGFACAGVGTTGIDGNCDIASDCETGMDCFKLQTEGQPGNTCKQFCITDEDCDDERKCDVNVNFQSGAKGLYCGPMPQECNPFEAVETGCGEGNACYLGSNGIKQCKPAGTLLESEVCQGQGSNACAPGLQCFIQCLAICATDAALNPGAPVCATSCENGEYIELVADLGVGICGLEPPGMCDIFDQTTCPNANEGCYFSPQGLLCKTHKGKVKGDNCDFAPDCEPGLTCAQDTCQEYCSLKPGAPEDIACDTKCDAQVYYNPKEWNIGACIDAEPTQPCDFWAQDCVAPQICYMVGNGATCKDPGPQTGEGGACQYTNDCAQGLYCASSVCIQPCSLDELAAPPIPICTEVCPNAQFDVISFDNQLGKCK